MSARKLLLLSTFTASLIACAETPTPPPAPMAGPAAPPPVAAPSYPHELGAMVIPSDNPQTDAKVKLGHQLFFDSRLSKDGSRSCYSCHLNEDGNGGHDPLAVGAGGKVLTRHSPVIWNVGYLGAYYWDGRSDSLEAQATAAWAGGNMGVGKDNLGAKAAEIAAVAGYAAQFNEVFPGEGVTPTTIVKALSAYERTLVCDDTAFDRYAKGDAAALNDAQRAGLERLLWAKPPARAATPRRTSPSLWWPLGVPTSSAPRAPHQRERRCRPHERHQGRVRLGGV
ncbi:MAG: cytochrome-c peroxidase [Deltaproteobacteria bacterium]|nr:cytochrome-c peroxidase [Deltaproteobacteria bacterium]